MIIKALFIKEKVSSFNCNEGGLELFNIWKSSLKGLDLIFSEYFVADFMNLMILFSSNSNN